MYERLGTQEATSDHVPQQERLVQVEATGLQLGDCSIGDCSIGDCLMERLSNRARQ